MVSVVTLWLWFVKGLVVTGRALSGLLSLSKTQMCGGFCQFYPTLLRFNIIGFGFRSTTRMSLYRHFDIFSVSNDIERLSWEIFWSVYCFTPMFTETEQISQMVDEATCTFI